MKQEYETIREFAKDYRLEIGPMMKSKGFTVSISTSKGSYYYDGRLNFQIKKIPSNFYVWTNEYNRYSKTEKSQKLLSAISTHGMDQSDFMINSSTVRMQYVSPSPVKFNSVNLSTSYGI